MSGKNESRIAIRFGASSASKGPKTSSRPAPSSALGKRQRHRFNNDDDSDGEDSEDAQHESITHFGLNGAEYVDEDRTRSDRQRAEDQKNARRRTKSPADEGLQESSGLENIEKVEEREQALKYGLTISKRPKQEAQGGETKEEDAPQEPRTADEEAIDALLGRNTGRQGTIHRTEDDAYRDAAATAPEVDDLATYDAIPVEGFGASLLKGQGWDGKMRGPKAKEITKRPNGMGLGAKKLTAEEELGGWDHKGKGKNDKRPRLDEYRREKDKERSRREERHRESYKNERDRHRDRDRDRDSHRHRERDNR